METHQFSKLGNPTSYKMFSARFPCFEISRAYKFSGVGNHQDFHAMET